MDHSPAGSHRLASAAWVTLRVDDSTLPLVLAVVGIATGLTMLWRGFVAHGTAVRVADTATSRIATLAAGEVRVSGVVESAEVTLTSPLQSVECVWYRSAVSSGTRGDDDVWSDERGVGFRIRDASGSIRVFPRDAAMEVEERFDEATDLFGEEPIGIRRRADIFIPAGTNGRHAYKEARLVPGDTVTIVGSAVPFGDLGDPSSSDALTPGSVGVSDPEVAGDVAEARAAGLLVAPEEAWGNAAIAGFGIGRPVRQPDLHPDATRRPLASAEEAAAIERTWDLRPDDLVLSSGADGRLLIADGTPSQAEARHQGRFVVGLLGAVLAIGSALAAAWLLASPADFAGRQ